MKTCSRCKLQKQEVEFYFDKRAPDGLKSQCKACHTEGNIRTRSPEKHRTANLEFMRKDRQINLDKYRLRERIASRNRPRDDKVQARYILNLAVRQHKITRPQVCEKCHERKRITAHHSDYSKPLDVVWLCYECHGNN